jgi:hypothetical protein
MLRCPKCESWFDPESEGSASKCPLCDHPSDQPFSPQISTRWVTVIHWIIISGFGFVLVAPPLKLFSFERNRELVIVLFAFFLGLYFVGTTLARTVVGKVVCGTFVVVGTVLGLYSIFLAGCSLLLGK